MDGTFVIGDFGFRLVGDITPPENFMLFAADGIKPSYTYTLELTERFPQPRGALIARRPDLAVFEQDGLEMRYIGVEGTPGFYACYREEDARSATMLLAPAAVVAMGVDPMFLAMFAMERHMMRRDALVLHCAYMQREGKAILFSAPSGTGKTTQATLWEKHRGTRVVNGDKALIRRVDGYAAVIYTYDSYGNVVLEQYADATGACVDTLEGYAQRRMRYDRLGRVTMQTYLNAAGGHLAASLCGLWQRAELWQELGLAPEDVRPNAAVLCYPVICADEDAHRGSFVHLSGAEDVAAHQRYSVLDWVSGDYPPTFLWHTFTDESVPVRNSLRMALALADAGVLTEVHIYPKGRHGLSLCNDQTSAAWDDALHQAECAEWPRLAARFLKNL